MIPQNRFKLTRQAMLLATISAAFPVTAYSAAAGHVDFTIGKVESVTASGRRHTLKKGAEINAGETIRTAAGARAQIRFADGGYISLQPNTRFRVDEFKYRNKADGEERGFFSLLKGGFRAITGAIGRVHKKNYRVKTAAATLGIRGTGYNMALRDDGLFVNVGEGAIFLSNKAGLLVVTAGGAAYVANFNTAPVPTNKQPLTPPAGLGEPTFTVADNRDSSGNPTLFPVLVSGPGYVMAYAYTGSAVAVPAYGAAGMVDVTATFSSAGSLTDYSQLNESGAVGAATTTSATDGVIGWGRWAGVTTGAGGPNPLSSTGVFDYVVGIPTAVMPTTGTATYSLMGYTSPTDTAGTPGLTLSSGSLSVDFAAALDQVGVAFTVTDGGTATYAVTGAATITGSNFYGTGTAPASGSVCTSGSCGATINGFFAGTNASRAGMSYTIDDLSAPNNIQGVAVFAKN